MKLKNFIIAFRKKKLFKIESLNRVFFASDKKQAMSKFPGHENEVVKANLFDIRRIQ